MGAAAISTALCHLFKLQCLNALPLPERTLHNTVTGLLGPSLSQPYNYAHTGPKSLLLIAFHTKHRDSSIILPCSYFTFPSPNPAAAPYFKRPKRVITSSIHLHNHIICQGTRDKRQLFLHFLLAVVGGHLSRGDQTRCLTRWIRAVTSEPTTWPHVATVRAPTWS